MNKDINARDLKVLLNSLDRHVAALEAEVDDTYAEYGLIPSQDQLHYYVSNTKGIIQLDQDAAFVCLSVILCGPANYISESTNVAMTATYVLSVMQAGPKKYITFSRNKAPLPTDTSVIELSGAPTEMFVPIANNGGIQPPFRNTDYLYELPVEWQIPRGDTVQALFPQEDFLGFSFFPGGTLSQRLNAFPKVVLAGYKVF
jgi:hypothetical protein